MLIFTLTMDMENLLLLVYFFSLSHCQPVTVREDTQYETSPKQVVYSEPQYTIPEHLIQEGQLQYYKAPRRSNAMPESPLQYTAEEVIPDANYNYPSQQPLDLTQGGAVLQKPQIEQYLKEVTPTTKTVYNRRVGNILRSTGQTIARGNKQQAEEAQRQLPFRYILQPQLQQKLQPQIQYEISEPKAVVQQTPEQQSQALALSRYQNAILAHQKVLETESQDDTSRSSIYVNQAIPKKPIRKTVKPKQPPADDIEYYTQLQQYQQELQQKQTHFYERQQPAEVMYQSKLKEDVPTQPNNEDTSTYQTINQQQLLQYQPLLPSRQVKKSRQPTKYQQAQDSVEPSYEYQSSTKQTDTPVVYEQPVSSRENHREVPGTKSIRYQTYSENPDAKYQQFVIPGQQQALVSYGAALAKLQAEQAARIRPESAKQKVRYQQPEQNHPTKYQLQYTENQQGLNQEETEAEYLKSEQPIRFRPSGRGVAYRQPPQGIRYYRNPRPIQYSRYE